jgi:acyl-ACP thioesterase
MNSPAFTPEPGTGRVFAARRMVRSTDVTPSGRLRLDALARYLQNVAEDDVADALHVASLPERAAGGSGGSGRPAGLAGVVWLVRRCAIEVRSFPVMGDRLTLRTFCSGVGPRWAERTTTVSGEAGDLMQATALWAAISAAEGRPVPPGEEFDRLYGEAAHGRVVSARLSHPRPVGSGGRPWTLRAADFDTARHVNNAVHWAAVEDVLAEAGWAPAAAEVEYQRAIQPGCEPRLVTGGDDAQRMAWLLDGERVLASARLRR